MNDHYVEVLVRRESEEMMQRKRSVMRISIAVMFGIAFFSAIPIFYILTMLLMIVYYFAIVRANVEFEYFYMNGELEIAKVVNKTRRKNVLAVRDERIKLIVPVESVAQLEYGQLKTVNCAAKSTHQDNYAIIFSNRNVLEKVIITMDDNLLKELTLRMPSKVNTDERK